MWIKSQDGTELIKAKRIQRCENEIFIIFPHSSEGQPWLKVGEFKTEEEAKEEMEQIEYAIREGKDFYQIEEGK